MAKASRIAARQAATLEQLADKIDALEAKINELASLIIAQTPAAKEEKPAPRARSTK